MLSTVFFDILAERTQITDGNWSRGKNFFSRYLLPSQIQELIAVSDVHITAHLATCSFCAFYALVLSDL